MSNIPTIQPDSRDNTVLAAPDLEVAVRDVFVAFRGRAPSTC